MKLSHRMEYNICIVTLEGRFAMEGAHEVRRYVASFLEDRNIQGMVLNFSQVDFVSSEGINVTAFIYNSLKDRQARLALCGINDNNAEFFQMTGIDKVIEIYKAEADALHAVSV